MSKFKSGDEVEFVFRGQKKLEKGIYYENSYGGKYIMSNNPDLDGGHIPRNGMKYAWYTDGNITKMRKAGEEYVEIVTTQPRYPIGCDPEFFFMENGKVLSSELILPTKDINTEYGKLTIDGVQAEINPRSDTCRESHSYYIATLINEANNRLKEGQSISFDPLVPIELSVLDKLSDKAKYFGCTPSFNAYDSDNKMSIADSSKYPFRPAGGHIHLGHGGNSAMTKLLSNVKVLIPLMDVIVANTFVLIDRHEGNKERRLCYGRAGEYRTPKHGVEYRTLSNFWLNSYPLMSLAFGLSRMCIDIIASSTKKDNFVQQIMDAVDINMVRKAINTNDFDLALKNFSKIKPILERIMPDDAPLNKDRMKGFLHFVGMIKKNGYKYWFPNDPVKYWCDYAQRDISRGNGWESFVDNNVKDDMSKATQLLKSVRASIKK